MSRVKASRRTMATYVLTKQPVVAYLRFALSPQKQKMAKISLWEILQINILMDALAV